MAEALSRKLNQERSMGRLTGIRYEREVQEINHSQFVDDTILLGSATKIIVKRFKKVLDTYLEDSGGKINKLKTKIFGWNITRDKLQAIARIFGYSFSHHWKNFNYLGMPISSGALTSQTWLPILNKAAIKIQRWGARWLNPARRIVLIKSILSSQSIYQCMALMAPKGIVNTLSSTVRKFL